MDRTKIYENPVTRTKEYLPEGTLESRIASVQKMLSDKGIDVLIVQRNFENTDRWFCNAFGGVGPSNGFVVAFPTGRAFCTERSQTTADEFAADRNGATSCDSTGRFIDWASDVDVRDFLEGYTKADAPGREDWQHPTCDLKNLLAAGDIRARAAKVEKIGIVDMDNVPVDLIDFLGRNFPDAEVVDVTVDYCAIKAAKTGDDLDVFSRIVAQHNGIMGALSSAIIPGALEREIYNAAKYAAYRLGAGGFNWMNEVPTVVTTFPMTEKWSYEPVKYPGRAVAEGDCVLVRVQARGMSGYFGAIGRCWTIGEPTAEIRERWQRAVEATDYCASLLKPGKSFRGIIAELNEWMAGQGYETPRGNYVHGVGYSLNELPAVQGAYDLPIEAGMVIAVGVPVANRGEGLSPFVCEDMFLVKEGGAELLTKFPRAITVV